MSNALSPADAAPGGGARALLETADAEEVVASSNPELGEGAAALLAAALRSPAAVDGRLKEVCFIDTGLDPSGAAFADLLRGLPRDGGPLRGMEEVRLSENAAVGTAAGAARVAAFAAAWTAARPEG
eukprot:gene21127-15325_t